ncbi:MAG: NAD(P)H-binding protein [Planctomycetota bacterium]
MRVTVFGASGRVGRRVVRQATARGHSVTAAVRPASGHLVSTGDQTRLCVCDVYAGHGVGQAIEGCDAVISCLGIKRRNPYNPWSPIRSPEDLTARSTANIVAAMKTHGVRKLACVSAAGVGESFSSVSLPIRWLIRYTNLAPAYRDLGRMESVLTGSGIESTALRPTTLLSVGPCRPAREVGAYKLWSWIPRASVARSLIDAIEGSAKGPSTLQIS